MKMTKKQRLKEISELSNSSLLDLYSKLMFVVRFDHYDPFGTPILEEFYRLEISPDEIKSIVLERMNNYPNKEFIGE